MEWVNLESSHITRARFIKNPHDSEGELQVEFRTGKKYKYKNVLKRKADDMIYNSSPGYFFLQNIRGEHDSEPIK